MAISLSRYVWYIGMGITVGIVGHEQAKFTPETEAKACAWILNYLRGNLDDIDLVVSGECHLGGVDIYAKEIAQACGIPFRGFPPKELSWEKGYKQRNLEIANASDIIFSIVVNKLPEGYVGLRFPKCYHCGTDNHIKSGGCWTLKQALQLGKKGEVVIIS